MIAPPEIIDGVEMRRNMSLAERLNSRRSTLFSQISIASDEVAPPLIIDGVEMRRQTSFEPDSRKSTLLSRISMASKKRMTKQNFQHLW